MKIPTTHSTSTKRPDSSFASWVANSPPFSGFFMVTCCTTTFFGAEAESQSHGFTQCLRVPHCRQGCYQNEREGNSPCIWYMLARGDYSSDPHRQQHVWPYSDITYDCHSIMLLTQSPMLFAVLLIHINSSEQLTAPRMGCPSPQLNVTWQSLSHLSCGWRWCRWGAM